MQGCAAQAAPLRREPLPLPAGTWDLAHGTFQVVALPDGGLEYREVVEGESVLVGRLLPNVASGSWEAIVTLDGQTMGRFRMSLLEPAGGGVGAAPGMPRAWLQLGSADGERWQVEEVAILILPAAAPGGFVRERVAALESAALLASAPTRPPGLAAAAPGASPTPRSQAPTTTATPKAVSASPPPPPKSQMMPGPSSAPPLAPPPPPRPRPPPGPPPSAAVAPEPKAGPPEPAVRPRVPLEDEGSREEAAAVGRALPDVARRMIRANLGSQWRAAESAKAASVAAPPSATAAASSGGGLGGACAEVLPRSPPFDDLAGNTSRPSRPTSAPSSAHGDDPWRLHDPWQCQAGPPVQWAPEEGWAACPGDVTPGWCEMKEGYPRCTLCGKFAVDAHLSSPEHLKRLTWWQEAHPPSSSSSRAPPLMQPQEQQPPPQQQQQYQQQQQQLYPSRWYRS